MSYGNAQQTSGWQVITVVVLLFALLISLLPRPDHPSVAMTCPLLVTVFLFGAIDVAIQDQLGLKLEPAKGPIQLLVIDHIEKPSEN
jgi:hypothetical protein